MSFSYNDEGLRVTKTVNGVTTNYYYQGSVLYAEETDEAVIVYIYDQNGSPMGFQYHGADYADGVWDGYAYEKNMFGDIVAVYDVSTGLKLISYTYDAWGTCTKTTYYNSGDTTSAINNPYRYRGYYYDEDLCMYYLQSRYYDPVVCRFISPDALMSGVNGSLHGYNLYAYCFNNPILYTDSEGEWPKWAESVAGWINENIIKPSKQFISYINTDLENYNKDNTSESVVFKANYFSSYYGTFVIMTPLECSFSFGFIGLSVENKKSSYLNHEYGHKLQLDERGWRGYIFDIAIPSFLANRLDGLNKLPYDYYGSPWEAEADVKGLVTRYEDNTPWPDGSYDSYWDLIKLFFKE